MYTRNKIIYNGHKDYKQQHQQQQIDKTKQIKLENIATLVLLGLFTMRINTARKPSLA